MLPADDNSWKKRVETLQVAPLETIVKSLRLKGGTAKATINFEEDLSVFFRRILPWEDLSDPLGNMIYA